MQVFFCLFISVCYSAAAPSFLPDNARDSLEGQTARMQYRAFDPAMKFISKDYTLPGNRNSRIPDFRNTLYWNSLSLSSTETGKIVEFSDSDFLSEYDIIVQGITSEGRFISEKRKLNLCR